MSGFIASTGTGSSLQNGTMFRSWDENTVVIREQTWIGCGGLAQQAPWQDGVLWPNSRFSGSDQNFTGLFGQDSTTTGMWGIDNGYQASGGQQFKKIIGFCRDSTGALLASCVVQGFVTTTDLIVGQMTCDLGGYFEFCTQYTGQHYLTAYKQGSPDVAGQTVNTLVGV